MISNEPDSLWGTEAPNLYQKSTLSMTKKDLAALKPGDRLRIKRGYSNAGFTVEFLDLISLPVGMGKLAPGVIVNWFGRGPQAKPVSMFTRTTEAPHTRGNER
jgi:hypothetical protein